MTHKETEILITKYLHGETSVEEEKQLALEVMRDDAPREWKIIAAMLGELATDEALFDQIMEEREARRPAFKIHRHWWWAAAASLLLLIGWSITFLYNDTEKAPLIAGVDSVEVGTPAVENTSVYTCEASDDYQDPELVTRFIGELAKVYRADSLLLDCQPSEEGDSWEAVYVFSDNKEQDLIGRLVQAACWYDNSHPGYRLSLTNEQFIFELDDSRRDMHYLWMAERVRGNILLHCSHTTGNSPAISACYREFRNDLANNPFGRNNHKTIKI